MNKYMFSKLTPANDGKLPEGVDRWWEMSVRAWKRHPVVDCFFYWDLGPNVLFKLNVCIYI